MASNVDTLFAVEFEGGYYEMTARQIELLSSDPSKMTSILTDCKRPTPGVNYVTSDAATSSNSRPYYVTSDAATSSNSRPTVQTAQNQTVIKRTSIETISTPNSTLSNVHENDASMPREAVLQLIELYRSMEYKFKTTIKKRTLWEKISSDLESKGFKKYTWVQVKNKWNNLLLVYRKAVDHNKSTGNDPRKCPFFDELDEFLSCRPNISPENLVSSFAPKEEASDASSSRGPTPSNISETPSKKRQRLTPRTEKIIDMLSSHEASRKEDAEKLIKEMHDEHLEFMNLEEKKIKLEKEKTDILKQLLEKL